MHTLQAVSPMPALDDTQMCCGKILAFGGACLTHSSCESTVVFTHLRVGLESVAGKITRLD